MAGAPKGNKNAVKENRLVGDMLRRIAKQNPNRLRAACEKLLSEAEQGNIVAFKEFADRIDGKVPQGIEGTGENGEIKVGLTVSYVAANNSPASGKA